MTMFRCYASCSFGIEGVLTNELKGLGFANIVTQDARVYFDADEEGIARANIFLRTADRVYIVLKEFEARTFEQLYENIRGIDFADLLPSDARFPVSANAVRSQLMSVSDIQSISKKAVVTAMQRVYPIQQFDENGSLFHIFVNLYKDFVTVGLNTSGVGMNRRGYRLKNVQAPLKETLAAALLLIARWHSREFYDPMCGSGTIAIEAAMLAAGMAPGIKRRFDAQGYSNAFKNEFTRMREYAKEQLHKPEMLLFGRDQDAKSIALAKEHARNMDVGEYIHFSKMAVSQFEQPEKPAIIVTNPPYAMRLGEEKETQRLYKQMGRTFAELDDTLVFVICANEQFEKFYGHKADRKRKLYNGNIKCDYYQYFRRKH